MSHFSETFVFLSYRGLDLSFPQSFLPRLILHREQYHALKDIPQCLEQFLVTPTVEDRGTIDIKGVQVRDAIRQATMHGTAHPKIESYVTPKANGVQTERNLF